jgi:hypothetical protein
MKHRYASLIDNMAVAASGVVIYNLKGMDPISELVVQFRGANAAAVPLDHPAGLIPRIQVVDGSEVIVDISGKQAVALDYYHYKAFPKTLNVYVNTLWCGCTFRIPFGRWQFDPVYALDPARFKNLQVIITVNLLGGGNGLATGTLELMATMFDEKKIAPTGCLRSREHFRYTPVALAAQLVDLPTDKTIKMMLFQGDANLIPLLGQINRVRISEDNDKRIPLDNNVSDIIVNMAADLPAIVESIYFAGVIGNITCFAAPFFEPEGVLGGTDAVNNWGQIQDLGGGNIRLTCAAVGNARALVKGIAPFGTVAIECGDPWDPDDWYNPSGVKQLTARLLAGGAVGVASVNKVVLQQLSMY